MQHPLILKLHEATDECFSGTDHRATRQRLHAALDEIEGDPAFAMRGDSTHVQEAQPMVTSYDMREAEDKRLWGAAGGPPAFPFLRWSQRQTEALPNEYPRGPFDEQTMTDQLIEAASSILHSVDAPTRRRVMLKAIAGMEQRV